MILSTLGRAQRAICWPYETIQSGILTPSRQYRRFRRMVLTRALPTAMATAAAAQLQSLTTVDPDDRKRRRDLMICIYKMARASMIIRPLMRVLLSLVDGTPIYNVYDSASRHRTAHSYRTRVRLQACLRRYWARRTRAHIEP